MDSEARREPQKGNRMTTKMARKLGYEITREGGLYYVDQKGMPRERRVDGCATRREAVARMLWRASRAVQA